MKTINIPRSISPRLLFHTGKVLAISTVSASLSLLPYATGAIAQFPGECNYYGCYPPTIYTGDCPDGYSRPVLVEFVARGDDWGGVWLNKDLVFQPTNFNRRQTFNFCPGAYRLIFTGATRFQVWAAGYLDVGRTNVLRIAFSKDGTVEVSGDRNAWLPDENIDSIEVWRR